MSSYCDYAPGDPFHGSYHDEEYGFPIEEDDQLFGRLLLEINQAGLSWLTILKKKESFQNAYDQFQIETVANYGAADRERLLSDPGIIRNRLKVDAAIHNAKVLVGLKESHGSFRNWLQDQHPLSKPDWVKLFRKTFKFTGGEITGEFLMSIGYLEGAHRPECPVFEKIRALNPPWMEGAD